MFRVRPLLVGNLIIALTLSWSGKEIQAASLTGSFSPVTSGSNVNLSVAGGLDWVHWGLYTDTSVNRKAGVSPQIGNFTAVGASNGFVVVYQFADNANGYSWADGHPATSVTNTPTGVWAYCVPNKDSGFEFEVPADTTERTLQVFVGVFKGEGAFIASLSDGSAPSYTDSSLFNTANGPGAMYTLTYAASAPGQTLRVRWTLAGSAPGNPTGANVTLQAAALSAAGANSPPFVRLTNPVQNAAFPEPGYLTLEAEAQDFDGTVTNVAFYSGATKLGDISTAPYSLGWSDAPRGRHTLSVEVADNTGAVSRGLPVEVFIYGTGGSQSVSAALPPAAVNLTTEGIADWTHWGLATSSSFNFKSGVPRQISNFTKLGTNGVQHYSAYNTAFSWSDGSPTSATNNSTTGVYITGVTNGFRLTAPADTQTRQLRIYVGGYGTHAEFQAYLSDLSAQPFGDSASISNVFGSDFVVYTIDYAAASAGQELILNFRSLNPFDLPYGYVALVAATLQGGSSVVLPVYITNATRLGNDFVLSFNTETGRDYTVEYADALPAPAWSNLVVVSGNGGLVTVTNQSAHEAQRYFRVRTP